jgi:ParB-like chromosome segregation protein Spo0J
MAKNGNESNLQENEIMIQKIPINKIIERKIANHKGVRRLVLNLKKGNKIDPIQVVPFADVFYIIDGHTRFAAMLFLNYEEVECEILHQSNTSIQ